MEIVKEEVEQKINDITDENLICVLTKENGNVQIVTGAINPKELILYLSQVIIELTKQIK